MNIRIAYRGQILQGFIFATVKGPPADHPAEGLQRFRAEGGHIVGLTYAMVALLGVTLLVNEDFLNETKAHCSKAVDHVTPCH